MKNIKIGRKMQRERKRPKLEAVQACEQQHQREREREDIRILIKKLFNFEKLKNTKRSVRLGTIYLAFC